MTFHCMSLKDDGKVTHTNKEKPPVKMYGRLLSLASSALTEVCFIDSMLAVHLHSQCMNGTLLSPQNLKLLICLRKSSSQRNQICGRNHTSRRLHGNHVLTEDLQIQVTNSSWLQINSCKYSNYCFIYSN